MTEPSKLKQDEPRPQEPTIIRTRDELDSALEAGLKSGESELTGREIIEAAIAKTRK